MKQKSTNRDDNKGKILQDITQEMPTFIDEAQTVSVPDNVTRIHAKKLLQQQPNESIEDTLKRLENEKTQGE